ncbi:unnamed protein product [Sphenostylis stenocarpa]|uniref:Uncharacterized protein n=1 Tax=Sphenostylis stenocarpa TaxID=92480 RepID=A0AA86VG66_9FABA|nr:unnamed protein product [Sphenostylis stenocarpa]
MPLCNLPNLWSFKGACLDLENELPLNINLNGEAYNTETQNEIDRKNKKLKA